MVAWIDSNLSDNSPAGRFNYRCQLFFREMTYMAWWWRNAIMFRERYQLPPLHSKILFVSEKVQELLLAEEHTTSMLTLTL